MEQRCRACGSPTRRLEVAGQGGAMLLFPLRLEFEASLGDDFDWDSDPRWLCRFSRVGGQRVVRQDGHFSNRPSPNRTCNFQSIRLSSEPFFRCSEVHRLSALRIPLYLPSGSPVALRHVVGFPVLGLLRRLRSHEALAF